MAHMERRDLLKLGAATALAGCATSKPSALAAVPPAPAWTPEEVELALADMDATLDKLAAAKPRLEAFGAPRTLDARRVAQGHDLTVRTLAAMHISASFRELPAAVQAREDVQRRMWSALPFIDDAMLDMNDYVASLTPAERRSIQDKLREQPSLAMDTIGTLDEQAAAAGVPMRRRLQMRTIAARTSWRMTRQSVNAVLDDTLDKVRRVRERHGRNEQLQRAIAAKVAEAELFGAPRSHLVFAAGVPEPRHRSHPGSTVMIVGGVLLGVGIVSAGVGALMLTSGDSGVDIGGAIAITIGAGLGLAGIITLIVGAVISANAKPDSNAEEGD
jgi:hypothetical protein